MSRVRVAIRGAVVFAKLLPLLLVLARDRQRYLLFGSGRTLTDEDHERRAELLVNTLLDLGPGFIKLGQTLSTRPDLLPSPYIRTLEQLQDEVPPAPWPQAKEIIEAELGPIEEVFDEFDTESISGASLGQVYRATADGTDVAVKVRRPGVESQVNRDIELIETVLPLLLRRVSGNRAFSLENLVDQLTDTIREEMDYEREARMLTEIRANFEDDDRVVIPSVVESHSTGRVLTMTYVGGTKLSDLDELDDLGHDRVELSTNARQIYLQMILIDGVFHADPHPGNIAVNDEGQLVLYDFGMSTWIDEELRNTIIDFYLGLATDDIGGVIDAMVEMGTLSPEAAENAREDMEDLIELHIQDIRGEDVDYYRVGRMMEQVEDTIYMAPFRITKDMALVIRVAMIGEGVCVMLDPEHDIVEVTADFMTNHGYLAESVMERFASTAE
ncbi:MAG: AarF/ABC1/UbiB kinase family protein [Natrialbaceae archaeon]|nr:AarF/ABC1/UbiB kinase family protein [Natrialbaceae archaeon]